MTTTPNENSNSGSTGWSVRERSCKTMWGVCPRMFYANLSQPELRGTELRSEARRATALEKAGVAASRAGGHLGLLPSLPIFAQVRPVRVIVSNGIALQPVDSFGTGSVARVSSSHGFISHCSLRLHPAIDGLRDWTIPVRPSTPARSEIPCWGLNAARNGIVAVICIPSWDRIEPHVEKEK